MTALEYIMVYYFFLVPVLLEIALDKMFWDRNKDDKPVTTWLRGLFMALIVLLIWGMGIEKWYLSIPVIIAFHAAIFPYLVNWSLGRGWSYLGNNPYDRWLMALNPYLRVLFQALLLGLTIFIFEYFGP